LLADSDRLAESNSLCDTPVIRRNRLDDLVGMLPVRGAWAQLRAGVNDAAARSGLKGRRLRAEREAERIFEMSPALLAVAGFDGYLRRFNPAFDVFGYSREELLSRPWIEFAHPDDRPRMLEATSALEGGSDVVELENRVICREGSARWVKWSTRVVPDEGLFYAAGRDVTESRHAAEEQAALRRVAMLVARETAPDAVFAAVVREVCEVLGVDATQLGRYDGDSTVVSLAQWGRYEGAPLGARFPLEGDSVSARVLQTGEPARMDDYTNAPGAIAATIRQLGIRRSLGVPISVEGRVWGVMTATSKSAQPFPQETESRLQGFTELVATAISNATAYDKVRVLANEQAALRRVATLVAHGAHPAAVFDAVTREVAEVVGASAVSLARYDDDVLVVLAQSGTAYVRVGERYPLGGTNVTSTVLRTGRPARLDDFSRATGRIGEVAREAGAESVVAAPVVVEGRTWGVLVATWGDRAAPPDDTEERLARFAELLDTAIGNADSRDQLTASRARVLAAGDDARRRVVRDLHDGAQQRLVQTVATLKLAQEVLHEDSSDVEALLAEALANADQATAELRELAHGILPSVLNRGLRAGVDAVASRLDLPVEVDVSSERLPPDIEASAYFIIAEALTNVVKHARATRATVWAAADEGVLTLEVRDDGVGGANPNGHGLMGIADRVDALGGRLRIESSDGDGTLLAVRLPLSTR
jgi:PAS domain S-box-containing protein